MMRRAIFSMLGFMVAGTLPAFAVQQPKLRLPAPFNGVYEGEYHFKREGTARVQSMRGYGPQWSRDHHLLWDGKIGDQCRLKFSVRSTSRYRMILQLTRAGDYGHFHVYVDGKKISEMCDLYDSRVILAPVLDLGEFKLEAGVHELTFRLVGAHPKARPFRNPGRFLLGFDYMKLRNLDPTEVAPRPVAVARHLKFSDIQKTFASHCYQCHGARKQEGDLNLQSLKSRQDFLGDLERARKIVELVESGKMPPEKSKQPSLEKKTQLVLAVQNWVDESILSRAELEPIVMRRFNRYEYNNSVKELLQLKGDIYPLPERVIRAEFPYFQPIQGLMPETVRVGNRTLGKNVIEKPILAGVFPFAADLPSEFGFNNRGEELGVSPLQLETFVKLAQSIMAAPQFKGYCRDYPGLFEPPGKGDTAAVIASNRGVARQRLARLLEKAFRSSVDESTLERYQRFFSTRYELTGSFSTAMKDVVAAVISSPRFLYMTESGSRDQSRIPLSDYELATRLSMFLWSSIPDDNLLKLAREGKLSDPQILETQVREMLWDPRSQALSENFARQWLRLDQLITAVPDMKRFPTYYSRIGCEYWKLGLQSMVEPLLLFESVMMEDTSIMQLIDSDYTYRSDELQHWYTSPDPFGNKGESGRFNTNQQDFHRRVLKTKREGGVITTAAVLTMNSSPLRTSPITRGAWVAGVIFNRPPPPPPDVVPEIEADDAEIEAQGITLRQRLKQHQTNQTCASCHAKIDPLGFVLENYDAVGRWREKYRSGLKIDASGKLFGEIEFSDIVSFKAALMSRPEVFTRAFTEHMMSYALGRELKVTDKLVVDKIVRNVLADKGRFSSVVVGIATSYPFRHKTSPVPPAADPGKGGESRK